MVTTIQRYLFLVLSALFISSSAFANNVTVSNVTLAAWKRILPGVSLILLSVFCFVTTVRSEPGIESDPMHTEAQFTIQGRPLQIVDVRDKKVDEGLKTTVQETYGKLPLYFIRNDGHMDERVKFYERGSGHSMFFTGRGIYLSLVKGQKSEPAGWIKQGESTNPVGITAENTGCVMRDSGYTIQDKSACVTNHGLPTMDYASNSETENP